MPLIPEQRGRDAIMYPWWPGFPRTLLYKIVCLLNSEVKSLHRSPDLATGEQLVKQ